MIPMNLSTTEDFGDSPCPLIETTFLGSIQGFKQSQLKHVARVTRSLCGYSKNSLVFMDNEEEGFWEKIEENADPNKW